MPRKPHDDLPRRHAPMDFGNVSQRAQVTEGVYWQFQNNDSRTRFQQESTTEGLHLRSTCAGSAFTGSANVFRVDRPAPSVSIELGQCQAVRDGYSRSGYSPFWVTPQQQCPALARVGIAMMFDDLPPSPYWLLFPELQLVVARVSVRYRQRDFMVERACDEISWRDGSKGAIGHQEDRYLQTFSTPCQWQPCCRAKR